MRGGDLEGWGWPRSGPLKALCWAGANLVPVVDPEMPPAAAHRALAAFSMHAIRTKNRSSSLVGERDAVMELWQHISRVRTARDARANPPSMRLDAARHVGPYRLVRGTNPDVIAAVSPASVARFNGDVAFSPLGVDGGLYSASHVLYVIGKCRSYVHTSTAPKSKT